jgi:hypothetical protein
MDNAPAHIIAAREAFDEKFYEAVKKAEAHMDLVDVDENDEDALADAYDGRFHCATCVVREVMEIMWVPIEEYILTLEQAVADK